VEAHELWGEEHRDGSPPLPAYLAFPGLPCDESGYSLSVAEALGAEPLDVDALADCPRPGSSPEQPDLYYSPFHAAQQRLLAALAGRGIRSTLTGLGGDTLLSATGREPAADLLAGRFSEALQSTGIGARPWALASWRKLWHGALKPLLPRRTRAWLRPLRPMRAPPDDLLTRRAARAVLEHSYAPFRRPQAQRYPDPAVRSACEQLDGPAFKLGLALADRLAGSVGAEYRHPFVDLELVELLLSMPHEQRAVAGLEKAKPVARRAMRSALPARVATRRACVSYDRYLRRPFERHADFIRSLWADSRLAQAGVIDLAKVVRMLEQGRRDGSPPEPMIDLVGLELWLRQATS